MTYRVGGQSFGSQQGPDEGPGWWDRHGGAVLTGVAAAATLGGTYLTVREARANREWQERMSNTAHQREVEDLKLAGLNPYFAAGAGGASTTSGDRADWSGLDKAVVNALMVQQMQSNVELTRAQALKTRTEAYDIQTTAPMRYRSLGSAADVAELDFAQRSRLFETAIEQARKQLELTGASARQVSADAALKELDRARAMNAEDLEKWLKGGSPGVRLFLEVLRGIRR